MHLRTARFFGLILLLLAAGCSNTRQIRYTSAQDAYQKGMNAFEAENYDRAIEYFRAVFSYGRYNEQGADAQLYIARAYRADKRYALAATEYARFIQLYSDDPRVAQAEFERAMTFYARSPRYFYGQEGTVKAINAFELFLARHPNSPLVPKAEAKVQELQEKLAHKQYSAGESYEQRELWEAASIAYETVFDKYPQTAWADDALLASIRTYIEYADHSIRSKQAERYQKAIQSYQTLIQVFPESSLLKEAEALYEEARAKLDALESRQSLAETSTATDGRA